uniref:IS4 family transposase n=1 Tax=Methylophaga lonarensis TaxID=999151 RepID=UPI003D29DBF6
MKATTILDRLLTDVTPTMHKVRRQSLKAMVTSLMSGASLSVTSLGRHILSQTTEKHQIKRSTRLCSNPHLQAETTAIYSHVALRLIGEQKRPVILVDWSDLDPRQQHFLLRAAVALEGRSLTLLEEIHPLSHKDKPVVHQRFMQRLKALLPKTCQPVVVTDAGFRVPWFKLVESLGWDYVGRVRNRTFCKNTTDPDWHAVKDLYAGATNKAKALGSYQLCRRNSIACQLHIYKRPHKQRRDLTAKGDTSRQSAISRANANREKEPWLLATSLAG